MIVFKDTRKIDERIGFLRKRKKELQKELNHIDLQLNKSRYNFFANKVGRVEDKYLYGVDKDKKLYNLLGAKTYFCKDKILIYADVNTNIIDGSSIWLINVATLFSRRYKVDILLKAISQNSLLISQLENNFNINIITLDQFQEHLDHFGDTYFLRDFSASELLYRLDMENDYHFIFCRGFHVSHYLASNPYIKNKLITYLLAQYDDINSLEKRQKIELIIKNSKILILQTELAKEYIIKNFSVNENKIILLPPLVDDNALINNEFNCKKSNKGCLYAGKFDINWRIPDIIEVYTKSNKNLTLLGNKFHDQIVDGRKLKDYVLDIANKQHNIQYIGAVPHDEMPDIIREYDYSISVRTDEFLNSLEFSTKILEFGYLSKPTIVNNSKINRIVLGDDYPLFANSSREISDCLNKIEDDAIYEKASRICFEVAQKHTMTHVSTYIFRDIEERINSENRMEICYITLININDSNALSLNRDYDLLYLNDIKLYDQEELYERAFKWTDVIIYYYKDVSIKKVLELAKKYYKKIFIAYDGNIKYELTNSENVIGVMSKDDYINLSSSKLYELIKTISNEIQISVIIPTKDTQPYMLYRAIDSVLKQKNIENYGYEIIIVDDESKELVSKLIKEHYDTKLPIRVIRNEHNQGLGLSRNIGLENSRGKHIYFLDADDFYNDVYISANEKKLEGCDYDLVICSMKTMYEDTNKMNMENHINIGIDKILDSDYDVKLKGAIRLVNTVVKAFRKKNMIRYRYFHDRGFHEDIFPWIKYYFERTPKIGICKEAIYTRTIRKNSNQITQNNDILGVRLQDLNLINERIINMLNYLNNGGKLDKIIEYYNNRYLRIENQLKNSI